MLASKQMQKGGNPKSQFAETYDTFMAISFCLDLGFDRVIFKGDAKNIVEFIKRLDGIYSN